MSKQVKHPFVARLVRRYWYTRVDLALSFAYNKGWLTSAEMHAIDHLIKYEAKHPDHWWQDRGRVLVERPACRYQCGTLRDAAHDYDDRCPIHAPQSSQSPEPPHVDDLARHEREIAETVERSRATRALPADASADTSGENHRSTSPMEGSPSRNESE